ncbi:MAG: hypothetical protein NW206_11260 [Hyphomonadaceae bacterium]|nr:hypothetical protein [Hyphomonadaceae bacterium]
MSLLKALGLLGREREEIAAPEAAPEACAETGRAVFQDAELILEDYHHLRVVITHVTEQGVRIAYAARTELQFRVRVVAFGLKLKCWARVVAQGDGVAELAFELHEPY